MTIGDLYTSNTNSNLDYIEIWERGRLILNRTLMDSMHLAWYDLEIKHFFCVPMWEENGIKYVVIV